MVRTRTDIKLWPSRLEYYLKIIDCTKKQPNDNLIALACVIVLVHNS